MLSPSRLRSGLFLFVYVFAFWDFILIVFVVVVVSLFCVSCGSSFEILVFVCVFGLPE